jgi:S-methylmethionine-dependent homocysteine/selenocysteine methylase
VCRSSPFVLGAGCNCVPPARAVAISVLAQNKLRSDQIVCVYPNVGCEYDAETKEWSERGKHSVEQLCRVATALLDNGCRLIGGCCGVSPGHIKAMRSAIDDKRASYCV